VLTGGLIHLVHQLAVVSTLRPGQADALPITILVTGVLRKQPESLAAMHGEIERWVAVLRRRQPERFSALHLASDPDELAPGGWGWALVNSQWLASQRQVVERLAIRRMVVCGDGLGVYYRCPRELRAIVPSLLGLPIPEPDWSVRYVLSGRQPRWHRPPLPPEPVPEADRRRLFSTLVEASRERGAPEVERCLTATPPERPLWFCSVPNLAHQFPGQRIPPEVLRAWCRGLQRQGFTPGVDRLLVIDHPKAPPEGSFGPLTEPWLAPPGGPPGEPDRGGWHDLGPRRRAGAHQSSCVLVEPGSPVAPQPPLSKEAPGIPAPGPAESAHGLAHPPEPGWLRRRRKAPAPRTWSKPQ